MFGKYDGNIIGGLLLGLGMGQAGACPGTLLPQLATGNSLALPVLSGAIFSGGHLATQLKMLLPLRGARCGGTSKEVDTKNQTVFELLGIGPDTGLILFEMLCLSILGTAMWWEAGRGVWENVLTWKKLYPVVGGVAIGLAQGASLLLRGRTLGASAVYEVPSLGLQTLIIPGLKWLRSIVFNPQLPSNPALPGEGLENKTYSKLDSTAGEKRGTKLETNTNAEENLELATKSEQDAEQSSNRLGHYETASLPKNWQGLIAFALGTYCGARIPMHLLPSLILIPTYSVLGGCGDCESDTVATGSLFMGGTLIILGSRIAGGCTSGHGISGMSMGAKSSFITVAAMFAGGIFGVRVLGSSWGFGWVSSV